MPLTRLMKILFSLTSSFFHNKFTAKSVPLYIDFFCLLSQKEFFCSHGDCTTFLRVIFFFFSRSVAHSQPHYVFPFIPSENSLILLSFSLSLNFSSLNFIWVRIKEQFWTFLLIFFIEIFIKDFSLRIDLQKSTKKSLIML